MIITTTQLSYNSSTKTFIGSERDILFATKYTIKNPISGMQKDFNFTHSTGSEWDPKTKFIYVCDDMTLEVCNDADICIKRSDLYKQAKLRN